MIPDSRLQYRQLFEANPLPMWVYDAETLRFLAVNDSAVAHYGYSRDEFLAMTIAEIRPPEDLARLEHEVRRPRPSLNLSGEWRHLKKDGTVLDVAISSHSLEFGGRPARFVLAVDVTERKRLEEARRRARKLEEETLRAREASRLKGQFLANMSHELRTPLNAIIGFAELMHDGKVGEPSAGHREFLADILTSSRHLLKLINDVLDLAKIEAGRIDLRPEPVLLDRLVREVRDILRGLTAEKRLDLVVESSPEVDEVLLDPGRLKQVLYNFLSNAIKFTLPGGRITVRTRAEGPDRFALEVEDTGPGIREEDLPRLFQEFEQLEGDGADRHGGTGLGLALTRKIVEIQGGRVGVRSRPGEGSTFFAVLPRVLSDEAPSVPAKAPKAAPEAAPEAGRSGLSAARVLVVEDDSNDREWLFEVLSQAGYEVKTARTAADALDLAALTRFDAITLDLLLPDGSGWELLHSIRASGANRDTPVIVVTVVAEQEVGRGFAIHDFLSKPVAAEELLTSLRRAHVFPRKERPVLVVDDDDSSLHLMQVTLESLGFRAVVASSGREGLELLDKDPAQAVIVDLLMPEMDGFEFLERLRRTAAGRLLPVIVWTSKDLSPDEQARIAASAQAVVHKGDGSTAALLRELRQQLEASFPSTGR